LPNDFQLNLDTHFVSSMILYKKYGESPIRVVRKSYPNEYGHQLYYNRLGYIYVFAAHMDQSVRKEYRKFFLDTTKDHLLDGRNIVIAPEGDCTNTEKSPMPFKAGAIRLALFVKPEPQIVPVSLANFDKRIPQARLAAIIHKPFFVSDHVSDPADNPMVFKFISDLHEKYKGYVRQAIELANA